MKEKKEKNLKKRLSKMKPENKRLLLAICVAAVAAYALTFVEIWQLIIVPGIVAGTLNKKMKRGIYSGALGISIAWILYGVIAMFTRNAYLNFDQFAGLIFGSLGYGWLLLIVILLIGALFGALGGAIGSGIAILFQLREESEPKSISTPNKPSESSESQPSKSIK